ncbi:MAG: hypothetical protein M3Q69_02280 [Acidobacteriota bacterium]|nr:hypothetical protein [Acidobacteriota bacterium]
MPLPVYDRPPIDPAAIVSFIDKERHRPNAELLRTVTPSPYAIRYERRQQRTNAARQKLSLERAREASLRATAREELERYATFVQGWDGYDGDAISPVALNVARLLVDALPGLGNAAKLTDIIPGPAPDGSLDLEFRTASRRLMLTIYGGESPNVLEIRTLRSQGDLREEKSDLDADTLVADLRWVLA